MVFKSFDATITLQYTDTQYADKMENHMLIGGFLSRIGPFLIHGRCNLYSTISFIMVLNELSGSVTPYIPIKWQITLVSTDFVMHRFVYDPQSLRPIRVIEAHFKTKIAKIICKISRPLEYSPLVVACRLILEIPLHLAYRSMAQLIQIRWFLTHEWLSLTRTILLSSQGTWPNNVLVLTPSVCLISFAFWLFFR